MFFVVYAANSVPLTQNPNRVYPVVFPVGGWKKHLSDVDIAYQRLVVLS